MYFIYPRRETSYHWLNNTKPLKTTANHRSDYEQTTPDELSLVSGPTPAERDTTSLLLSPDQDSYHLKERLVENEDFMLVPAEAWRKLLAWYGLVEGQPALERKVHPLAC